MSTKHALLVVVLFLLVSGVLITKNSKSVVVEEGSPVVAEETGTGVPGGTNPATQPKPSTPKPSLPGDLGNGTNVTGVKLDSKPWTWVSALYNDGSLVKPNVAGDFRITFEPTGDFYVSTDCNSLSGKYQINENLIDFISINSTKMFCPGSKELDFTKVLQNTTSFFFNAKGELVLELAFDSGTATFK